MKKYHKIRNKKFGIWASLWYIFIWVLFEVSFLTTVRINDSYTIASSIESYLLFSPINTHQDTYEDINNKKLMIEFIRGNIVQLIFNETNKFYPAHVKGYHYLQYTNYLMGARVTYNRAKLVSTSEIKSGTNDTRIGDYEQTSISSYTDVETANWGSKSIPYSISGGYKGLGGYIIHFPNDYSIEEVISSLDGLAKDGLTDSHFLSIVIEAVFYNENYQTGVVLSYEFLLNNAGQLKKRKHRSSFFESGFSSHYHQVSKITQIILIFLEVIFLFGLIWMFYEAWKIIYQALKTLIKIRVFTLGFYDYIDLSVVILILVSLGYRYYQMFNQAEIKLKAERISLEDLAKYINYSDVTKQYSIVASLATIWISISFLHILMMQFPSFGTLFEILAVSIKDILDILATLTIILIGFVISVSILFGDKIYDMSNFENSLNRLFYYVFGIGSINQYAVDNEAFFNFFYIVFSIIFYFVMIKMLVSIVIIRYRYLRSLKQLRNEAMARVVAKRSKILKERIKNLILFRRPESDIMVMKLYYI